MKHPKKFVSHPLMCWDIASQSAFRKKNFPDVCAFREVQKRHNWQFNADWLLEQEFDALVITDPKKHITWVSPGFKKMTGYSPRDVIGKTPSMLQGVGSTENAKRIIHEALLKQERVTATILNYRKDQSDYLCQLEILPLFSPDHRLINFIALEKTINQTT